MTIMAICNKDCFNCQYPDCVLDELDADDYRESSWLDREPKERTDKQRKDAAQKKAYREANRERYNAYMRDYRRRQKEERVE